MGNFDNVSNKDAVIKQVVFDSTSATVEIETWDNKRCEICCNGIFGFKSNTGIGQDIGDILFSRESEFFYETVKAQFETLESVPPSVQSMIICEASDNTPVLEVIADKFELIWK